MIKKQNGLDKICNLHESYKTTVKNKESSKRLADIKRLKDFDIKIKVQLLKEELRVCLALIMDLMKVTIFKNYMKRFLFSLTKIFTQDCLLIQLGFGKIS